MVQGVYRNVETFVDYVEDQQGPTNKRPQQRGQQLRSAELAAFLWPHQTPEELMPSKSFMLDVILFGSQTGTDRTLKMSTHTNKSFAFY